jgi:hypothetical protein
MKPSLECFRLCKSLLAPAILSLAMPAIEHAAIAQDNSSNTEKTNAAPESAKASAGS